MATKKTTSKKSPTKKSAPRKATTKKSSSRSGLGLVSQIGLRPEESEFMTFKITRQTLYWLVLGLVVILFTVWLMRLQMDIQALYDQIDADTAAVSEL